MNEVRERLPRTTGTHYQDFADALQGFSNRSQIGLVVSVTGAKTSRLMIFMVGMNRGLHEPPHCSACPECEYASLAMINPSDRVRVIHFKPLKSNKSTGRSVIAALAFGSNQVGKWMSVRPARLHHLMP
jgi:hypothetical protein